MIRIKLHLIITCLVNQNEKGNSNNLLKQTYIRAGHMPNKKKHDTKEN